METSAQLVDGYLATRTGSEGPRHDPYAFTETTVLRKGRKVTVHEGLACWLQLDGEEVSANDDVVVRENFKRLTGFSPGQIEKFIHRAQSRCGRCGKSDMVEMSGYPGETFLVCAHCDLICGSAFNRSAVE